MRLPVLLALVALFGGTLLVAATRATATVDRGRVFVRWMILAFAAFVGLVSLPLIVGS
jgi:hypothetical protein